MKTLHHFFFVFLLLGNGFLFSTDMDSSFSVKWENDSWGSGGLFPAGPPWNMVGPMILTMMDLEILLCPALMLDNIVMVHITMKQ